MSLFAGAAMAGDKLIYAVLFGIAFVAIGCVVVNVVRRISGENE